MAKFDNTTTSKGVQAFGPVTLSINGTINGNVIDTSGFEAVNFTMFLSDGSADGSLEPLIEDSDDGIGFLPVADEFLVSGDGTVPPEQNSTLVLPADNNSAASIGYIGSKQFVRLSVVTTGMTGQAPTYGLALLSRPRTAPTEGIN